MSARFDGQSVIVTGAAGGIGLAAAQAFAAEGACVVLADLKASGGTAIVNTASIRSLGASAGMPAYVSSKHGVAGLTKAAALDLIRFGIRVNAVCPGFIETPMLGPRVADPQVRRLIESKAPVGRLGSPTEVAEAVLFLASDAASYIVGALFSVDDGVAAE